MLSNESLVKTLTIATERGADFAEVFVEDKESSSVVLDDNRIEELTSSRDRGAGIRVVVGETTGFAHTSDLSDAGLTNAARVASEAARGTPSGVHTVNLDNVSSYGLADSIELPSGVEKARKVQLLLDANDTARAYNDSISQVSARYSDSRRRIQIANTENVLATDDQVRTVVSVSSVASGDSGLQTGRQAAGHTMGFELFDQIDVTELAQRAATQATTKLNARPAPSGVHTVVIGPGGGGVMFHEACGHGLEADLVNKGASVFANKIGDMVASPGVTLVDDSTMKNEWGYFRIDDEGYVGQRNVLIEDGRLVDYMWDGNQARKAGRKSSGNGRRQTYQHLPMVRMTNTYLIGGHMNPEDIIADTENGVYIAHLGGGQVNTTTGDFVFGMTEAFLIEDGKITEPLREGNLIGNGPEVLLNIDAIGNDFEMGPPGTCGKDGQGAPVGDGVPTLRVHGLTIGGTAQ